MTDEELRQYAKRLTTLNRAHDEAMKRRREEARNEAQRLAHLLYEALPGLKAVYGFGSVFEPRRPFTERSDIDLAIEGGELIDAVKICLKSTFPVDVIDISDPGGSVVGGTRGRCVVVMLEK